MTKVFEYSTMACVMQRFSGKIKDRAARLRKRGYSLDEISRTLRISKSTVYHWVSNIGLTRDQLARLHKKEVACGAAALRKARRLQQKKMLDQRRKILCRAKKCAMIVRKKSPLAKLLCGVLYLCEGAKYPSSRQMIFGSTDPRMITTFLLLLRNNFPIDEKKLRCRIMHRYDQDGARLNKYWSRITRIPLAQFYRHYKDKRSKGSPTRKPFYKGICAVQYNSTGLQYELQSIGESLYCMK